MPSSAAPSSTSTTKPTSLPPIPIVPNSLKRSLLTVVPAVVIGSAVLVAIALVITRRGDWWPGYLPATIVSVLGGIAAIAVLSRAAGRPVDVSMTCVMAAAGIRIAISVIGVAIAVKVFETPQTPTATLACGYYVATLLAESVVLSRAVQSATPPTFAG